MRYDSELELILKIRSQQPEEFAALDPETRLRVLKYEAEKRSRMAEIRVIPKAARQQPFNLPCVHGNRGLHIENGFIKASLHHDNIECSFDRSLDDLDRERMAHSTDDEIRSHIRKYAAELVRRRGKIKQVA